MALLFLPPEVQEQVLVGEGRLGLRAGDAGGEGSLMGDAGGRRHPSHAPPALDGPLRARVRQRATALSALPREEVPDH